MPFLTIIVPVFNKEPYLDSCISSILDQTFEDFELILINDGSSDNSDKRCDEFAKKDNRVIVVHQPNMGVSAARNRGISLSQGAFIGFTDADDLLENDMYEMLVKDAIRTGADIVACGVKKVFSNKEEFFYGTGKIKVYDRLKGLSAFFNKDLSHSVNDKIYKSNIAKSIKFIGAINEDLFFNFLAFQKAAKIIFHDVIKYNYIIRDSSVSMSAFNKKYMDSLIVSQKIIEVCKSDIPQLINEAKLFDLIANISLLNIILLNNPKMYPEEFNVVALNLRTYSEFVKKDIVSRKHKYAYRLFTINVSLYARLMKFYCQIFDAEALKRV